MQNIEALFHYIQDLVKALVEHKINPYYCEFDRKLGYFTSLYCLVLGRPSVIHHRGLIACHYYLTIENKHATNTTVSLRCHLALYQILGMIYKHGASVTLFLYSVFPVSKMLHYATGELAMIKRVSPPSQERLEDQM